MRCPTFCWTYEWLNILRENTKKSSQCTGYDR